MIHFDIFDMPCLVASLPIGGISSPETLHIDPQRPWHPSQVVMLVMLAAAALGKTLAVSAPPSSGPTKAMSPNKVVPSDVCWFVNPVNYRHIYIYLP